MHQNKIYELILSTLDNSRYTFRSREVLDAVDICALIEPVIREIVREELQKTNRWSDKPTDRPPEIPPAIKC